MSQTVARNINKPDDSIEVPGYHVADTEVDEIRISHETTSEGWLIASVAMAAVTFIVMTFIIHPLFLVAAPVGFLSGFIPTRKINWKHHEQIATVMAKNALNRVDREYSKYPALRASRREAVIKRTYSDFNLPKKWDEGIEIPIQEPLSRHNKSATYVIKEGRNVKVIKKKLVAEEAIWLQGFRKAMLLK